MIDLPDLDPQDHTARVVVRDQLKHVRAVTHGTARQMRLVSAAAGYHRWFVEDCEATTQWSVRRLNRWARILEHRVTMTVEGLEVPDDDDLTAALLAVATPFGGADEDVLHVRAVVNDLARAQHAQGLTDHALGKQIGCSNRAIPRWVAKPEISYVKTLQRYARGLGGALSLAVVPAVAAVSA